MKKVIIYTGDLCVHCDWAIELLNRKNIKFTEYNVAKDTVKREEMFKKSNGARTVPQIFIDEHHVGGNVELQALEKEGKLNSLLGI
jgi:glutaredoxin 3|tara:strand:- start:1619 stop:1876 length:258 start_codon:yes stop_codon:yes gene_type:complete